MLAKLKSLRNKKGFTLVELLVVIVIMCILAAIMIPSFAKYVDKAQNATIVAEARAAHVAASVVCQEAVVQGKAAKNPLTAAQAAAAVTDTALEEYTDVEGAISAVTATAEGTLTGFTYTNGDKQVVWSSTSGKYTVQATPKNNGGGNNGNNGNK